MTITISGQSFFVGGYQYGGSAATIRIYATKPFIASDGTAVPAGAIGSTAFFKSVACTVASNTLSCPSFTLPSTTDALDDQTARFVFVLYDSKGTKRDILFANVKGGQLSIPANLGSTLTFAQIAISNQAAQPLRDTSVYTKTETNTQIALARAALEAAPATLLISAMLNPAYWPRRENVNNPVFRPTGGGAGIANGLESPNNGRMDDARPVMIGSVLWAYVKEMQHITACRSFDGGVTWETVGYALSPGASGAWDEFGVTEPVAWYDQTGGVIHLWYKGFSSGSVPSGWGYATASPSAPTVFTRYGADGRIKTLTQLQTDLGLGAAAVDGGVSEVYKIGSTYIFAGYGYTSGNLFRAGLWTGSVPSAPVFNRRLFVSSGDQNNRLQILHSVFQPVSNLNYYVGFVAEGMLLNAADNASTRTMQIALSTDGYNWQFSDPIGTWEMPGDILWTVNKVYQASILKDPADESNLTPLLINAQEYLITFSGFNQGPPLQSGVMFTQPGLGKTLPILTFPATESAIRRMGARNDQALGGAGISFRGDANGTDVLIGSNIGLFTSAAQGTTTPREDTSKPSLGLLFYGSLVGIGGSAVFTGLTAVGVQVTPLTITPTGILPRKVVTPKIADATLTRAETGTRYTNSGAAGTVVLTLPTALIGTEYTFLITDPQILRAVAPLGVFIRGGASLSSAGGNIQSNTPGDSITLLCVGANAWVATSIVGTWTFA